MNSATTAAIQTVPEYLTAIAARNGRSPEEYGCECGRTWLKLYRVDGDSRSVLAFVRLSDGAVHGAASWKNPGRSLGFSLEVL